MATKRHAYDRPRPGSKTRKVKDRVPSQPQVYPCTQSIEAGNDFFMHVNNKWIQKTSIPSYLSSYSVSDEIEEQINNELFTILDDARMQVQKKANTQITTPMYLIGTIVESALNSNVQNINVNFIRNIVSKYGCIRSIEDVGISIGECIKYQINSIFVFVVMPSEKDTQLNRLTIAPGKLGLPDSSYYTNQTDDDKRKAITEYGLLLKKLGDDFSVPSIGTILSFEYEVASILQKSNYDTEVLMTGQQLLKQYPNIPWNIIVKISMDWTSSDFYSHTFLIVSTSWLKQVNRWFKTLSLDNWKAWLSANMLLHALPLLPPPYDDMDFRLYGHTLRGQSEKVPQRRLALYLVEKWLSSCLGEKFVEKFVPPSIKTNALNIASEIRQVASEVVETTEWLDVSTRKKAKAKIQKLYLSIAYPADFKNIRKIELHPEHLVQNIFTLSELDFKDELKKVNRVLEKSDWDDNVFDVNAYYYNEGNRLILPSGILRWPFFHSAASDGWNFGGIGATIGHEICHAFDADGKDYDEKGQKKTWWSKNELQSYEKKSKAIEKIFNKTKYFGQYINGSLTLSENIADLAGLSISLKALKKRLEKKGVASNIYKKELRDFFMSYATSWRTKDKRQKALQSIFMDVHAPPSARVNNIVCQFDDWYECFNVQPGDILYKSPEERIRIF
jgi:putative endopeptidase